MKFHYIEHNRDVIDGIDVDELSGLKITQSSKPRNGVVFHTLGEITVEGEPLHLGIKTAVDTAATKASDADLLSRELPIASVIASAAPEITSLLPKVFGRIMLDGDTKPVGMLVEDSTQGGELPIHTRTVSTEVQNIIEDAVCEPGREVIDDFFGNGRLEVTMAYSVGGEERILDFTPNPLRPKGYRRLGYKEHIDAVEQSLDELTIVVDPATTLGRSLRNTRRPE
ncbi:MAG TPA: hypothetical protein VF572_00670 [Candidatus Saccharimonadales bacterium]|jgi:hypothetical protein